MESVTTSSLSSEARDAGCRAAREHAVGAIGEDFFRALLLERGGRVAERSRTIDDVVDEDAGAAFDVADDVHHLGLAGPLAALVDDRQRGVVEPLGEAAGANHAADVRRNDHQIPVRQPRLDVGRDDRGGEQIVGRDVEEALDLAGVQVDRQDAVGAGDRDQVRDQLGRDRRARTGLPVLPGISEVREDRRDPLRRRAAQRVDADQQLHEVVVRRIARRLDDEHVLAAHVLVDLDENLFVGEAADARLGKGNLEIVGNRSGQRRVAVPREQFHRPGFPCGASP